MSTWEGSELSNHGLLFLMLSVTIYAEAGMKMYFACLEFEGRMRAERRMEYLDISPWRLTAFVLAWPLVAPAELYRVWRTY